MAWLMRLGLGAAALLALFLAIGFALPSTVRVEESVTINRSSGAMYGVLSDLRIFHEHWSPWAERDPDMTVTFSGPARGVGASMAWSGDPDAVGTGRMTVVQVDPGREIVTVLAFEGQGNATARWVVEPEDEGSTVTWAFESEIGSDPVSGWAGLMIARFVAADYRDGLNRLKTYAETTGAPA